jgi:hypothetical protein
MKSNTFSAEQLSQLTELAKNKRNPRGAVLELGTQWSIDERKITQQLYVIRKKMKEEAKKRSAAAKLANENRNVAKSSAEGTLENENLTKTASKGVAFSKDKLVLGVKAIEFVPSDDAQFKFKLQFSF